MRGMIMTAFRARTVASPEGGSTFVPSISACHEGGRRQARSHRNGEHHTFTVQTVTFTVPGPAR
jgi:hypothetical protein